MMALGLVFYLLVQVGISFWVSRWIKSEKDFLVAGRQMPAWMLSISLFATWFGAESCIGTASQVYQHGLSGSRADPLGYALALFLMGLLLARPLWKGGFLTLSDLFRERYSVAAERLSVWILIPASLFWGAAQMRAFGQIVSSVTDLAVPVAIVGAGCFVIVYTFLGGLMGDIITDVLQGFIVVVCLLAVAAAIFISDSSWSWNVVSMERWSLLSPHESGWQRLDRWLVPVLGSLVAQEMVARVLAARSAGSARKASFWAAGVYLAMGSVPVVLGLLGPQLLGDVQDSEQFLVHLVGTKLGPVYHVIFAGAMVSAILATVDSVIIAIAALVSHNFLVPVLKVKSERKKLWTVRAVVAAAGLVALCLALTSSTVYELVLQSSSLGSAGLLIITLAALYWPKGSSMSAIMTMIVGAVVPLVAEHILGVEAPFVLGVVLALTVFVMTNVLERFWKKVSKKGQLAEF